MSAIRATVDFGQLILTRPDLAENRVRLLATKWNRSGERRAVRLRRRQWPAGYQDAIAMCPHILLLYGRSLAGLHGVSAAVLPDG